MRTSFETLTYRAPPAPREAGLLRAEAPDRAGLFEPQCPHLSTGLSCIFFMVVGGGAAKRKKIPGLRRGPERQDHQAARAPSPVGGLGQQRWGGAWVGGQAAGGGACLGRDPAAWGRDLLGGGTCPRREPVPGLGGVGTGPIRRQNLEAGGEAGQESGTAWSGSLCRGRTRRLGTGPVGRQDLAGGGGACWEVGPAWAGANAGAGRCKDGTYPEAGFGGWGGAYQEAGLAVAGPGSASLGTGRLSPSVRLSSG